MSDDACGCRCGKPKCASLRGRTHGKAATYWNGGCRCEECRAVVRPRIARRKKRTNDESRDRATRARQTWTLAEMEVAIRGDLTLKEAAAELGRSVQAVSAMRNRCRNDQGILERVASARGGQ